MQTHDAVSERKLFAMWDAFAAWYADVQCENLRAKKTSVSASHGEYWQAIHPTRGIVGFFLTGTRHGELNFR